MALNTEKNTYTLLFAVGLVVIVGTLLAAIDSSLKDKIRINKILEKHGSYTSTSTNILSHINKEGQITSKKILIP